MQGKLGESEMEVQRGMVTEVGSMVSLRNLGWRQILRLMRAVTSVCMLVVVVAAVELVFFRERSLLMMKAEFSLVDFWLVGGGIFINLLHKHNFMTERQISTGLFFPHGDIRDGMSDNYLLLLLF